MQMFGMDVLRGYAFFAGAHAAPAPRARQGGILLLVCPRFMAGAPVDSCGAILRPLPPFMAKEALVLRHGCRIRGKFPPEPPRSSAPLRRSSGLQSANVLNGCGSGWGEQSASGWSGYFAGLRLGRQTFVPLGLR